MTRFAVEMEEEGEELTYLGEDDIEELEDYEIEYQEDE